MLTKMLYPPALQAKRSLENVSMDECVVSARSAEEAAFASMDGCVVSARSAEGAAFASMDEYAIGARSAEGAAFVSTDEDAISATEGVWRKLHMSTWTNAQSMQA